MHGCAHSLHGEGIGEITLGLEKEDNGRERGDGLWREQYNNSEKQPSDIKDQDLNQSHP